MKTQQSNASVRRIINAFYFAVATLIVTVLPASYFMEDYYGEREEVEAWVEKQAALFNNALEKKPGIWPGDTQALLALLVQTVTDDDDDETIHRVLDAGRNVLARVPDRSIRGFTLTEEAPLYQSKKIIGYYRVERSLQGLLIETLVVAIGGLFFALVIVFPLRSLPLRALQNALDKLEEEKERALITLRSIGDAVIVTDATMRVTYLNPVAQAMAGWTNEEAAGRPLDEVLQLSTHDAGNSAIDYLSRFLTDVTASGLTNRATIRRRSDEREFFIENSIAPIRSAQGALTGAVMVFHDVTERCRVEEQLRRSRMRSENALSIARLGTFEWNLDTGRIVCSARTREMFEFTGDEGHARPDYFDIIVPGDRERVMEELKASLKTDGRVSTEYRVQLSNGGIRHIVCMSTAEKDQHGVWVRRVGVFNDITERKNTEERLRDADRQKDEFLAMLAHELRNPLAPISAAAEILRHMAGPDQDYVRNASEIIERQVDHMTSLVDDLLDVSRVTSGVIRLNKGPVNMDEVLAAAVEQVTPMMQARRHRFAVHASSCNTQVYGDKKRLIQIVANLLNNAAKYTPDSGDIRLELAMQDEHVVVCVTDNGIGIPGELIHRVFDLFTQAERTPDRTSGGLGLGLALVKSLVELHGGKVACTSEGLGKGSTFKLRLPCMSVSGSDEEPTTRPGPKHEAQNRSLKILVVDDNADAASTLARLLELMGHQTMIEHDPMHALERARSDPPDICLLDVGLPGMDGIELGMALRQQAETSGVRLVAVSGYSQEKDRNKALSAGFEEYLVKPVNGERLAEILH